MKVPEPIPADNEESLTQNEKDLLHNMVNNDYGDVPDHVIWADCWDCGPEELKITWQLET